MTGLVTIDQLVTGLKLDYWFQFWFSWKTGLNWTCKHYKLYNTVSLKLGSANSNKIDVLPHILFCCPFPGQSFHCCRLPIWKLLPLTLHGFKQVWILKRIAKDKILLAHSCGCVGGPPLLELTAPPLPPGPAISPLPPKPTPVSLAPPSPKSAIPRKQPLLRLLST